MTLHHREKQKKSGNRFASCKPKAMAAKNGSGHCVPPSFDERVYAAVRQIPRGKVATYGQIAHMIGAPHAARFVGFALHRNPYEGDVPCHRVVFADGSLASGFAFGGSGQQRKRLEAEGVAFLKKRGARGTARVNMHLCQW